MSDEPLTRAQAEACDRFAESDGLRDAFALLKDELRGTGIQPGRALLRRHAELLKERDEAREWVRRMQGANTTTCVWCGHAYPPGTPAAGTDLLREHARSCPKNPLGPDAAIGAVVRAFVREFGDKCDFFCGGDGGWLIERGNMEKGTESRFNGFSLDEAVQKAKA